MEASGLEGHVAAKWLPDISLSPKRGRRLSERGGKCLGLRWFDGLGSMLLRN